MKELVKSVMLYIWEINQEYSEEIKGRVVIFDSENSEVAKNAKITKKGTYAIKIK